MENSKLFLPFGTQGDIEDMESLTTGERDKLKLFYS